MQFIRFRLNTHQGGFTLIELLIALTLGLIISAIAIQLIFTAQKGVSTQQALSNLQSDALFGLEAVVRDLRLANLNASDVVINDSVLHGGIVLSEMNYSSKKDDDDKVQIELVDAVSRGAVTDTSNLTGLDSDELVIQYQNIMESQYDCEGRKIPINTYVVQKYFVRKNNIKDEPNTPFSLACKSDFYSGDEPEKIDLSGNGEIIIPRIDHFRVLLGVASDKCIETDIEDGVMSCFYYVPIEDYKKMTGVKPQIVSLKIGMLVRSLNTVGSNDFFDKTKPYKILNDSAELIEDSKNHLYMRSVVTQTVALRNGFGIKKQS